MAEVERMPRREGEAASSLEVTITGRIEESRQNNGDFYTTIKAPGPDQYSSAMPFEVRSKSGLGADGAVVTVRCKVGGYYRKSFEVRDRDQRGYEITRTVKPVGLSLEVIG